MPLLRKIPHKSNALRNHRACSIAIDTFPQPPKRAEWPFAYHRPTRNMSVHTLQQPATLITVASGKGGVGKTNVASGLGLALSKAGKRVILLDMDLGLANLDVVLGARSDYHLGQVIKGERNITEIITRGPGGLSYVSGGPGDEEMANLSHRVLKKLTESLHELAWLADYLIIDTSAGLTQNTISFAQVADEVVVVTTPEPTALVDAYALIKTIFQKEPDHHLRLLVNMARNEADAVQIIKRLSLVVKSFAGLTLRQAGYLPYDDFVAQAVRKRKPFFLSAPQGPASLAIYRFAQRIIQDTETEQRKRQKTPTKEDFLQRLLNVFSKS